jgi:TIR domain-containing protein/SIR2-like protein
MTPAHLEPERFWDQLLNVIDEGRVVPIVGPDLLTLTHQNRVTTLYSILAERLAAYLGLPDAGSPHEATLNAVACRYMAQGGELEDVYSAIKSIASAAGELPIPEALTQLASITDFRLFVSVTFDSLLEQAINRVRFGGASKTAVLAYSPNLVQDLPSELQRIDRPTVFHLFGKVSAVPDYAVTEEDTLEFIHSLQSEVRRPPLLFDELNRRHLLILGSSFSDWLARFFIRVAKRERLSTSRGTKTDIVADDKVRESPGLVLFLQHFSTRTKVFQGGGAVEFVSELHRRWSERHPQAVAATLPVPTSTHDSSGMAAGAVFVSYASEDREAAEQVRKDLEGAGIDVWFDRSELKAGDAYEATIRRNIEKCSLFVPLISAHTLTRAPRFFRLEWDHAERMAIQLPQSATFIIPVVVDDTSPQEERLPERFRKLHWTSLQGGQTTPEFVAVMKQLFREYQKSSAAAP